MENNEPKEQIIDFKQYKWIVSSALQKSLRRGRFDLAKQYVEFLWEHDRNYITYRLGTILSEDVGIANLPLIKTYLDTKVAKKAIDEAGGLQFVLDIVEKACSSNKDRTSCDLAYLSSYFSWDEKNGDNSLENLATVFHNPKEHFVSRTQAAWLTLGNKKFTNDILPFRIVEPNEDNIEAFISLLSDYNNSLLTSVTENSYLTQRENIALGIPVVYASFMEEKNNFDYSKESKFKPGDVVEYISIPEQTFLHKGTGLEIISCGIDGHTKEGKAAYYEYLKNNNKFTQYMKDNNIPYDLHVMLLSHCIFRLEGHEVNKRVYFPTAVNVMRQCESIILNLKAGKELNFSQLKKIIIEDMPIINSLRENKLNSMPIPMIDKPEPKKPKVKKVKV